jgi:hypothetical protein
LAQKILKVGDIVKRKPIFSNKFDCLGFITQNNRKGFHPYAVVWFGSIEAYLYDREDLVFHHCRMKLTKLIASTYEKI